MQNNMNGHLCMMAIMATGFLGAAHAASNATGQFTAKILPGTCSVMLASKTSTLNLGQLWTNDIVSGSSLLSSDSEAQFLEVTCSGYPGGSSRPSLKVTGTDIGSGGNSLFRDGGTNPSTSLGFRVQAVKADVTMPDWSTANYLNKDVPFLAFDVGKNVNNAKIPVRFTMWCVPGGGKSEADCKQAGALSASLTFSLDYE